VKTFYSLFWYFSRLTLAPYFRWRLYHVERVPPTGPVILAANHESYLDPFLIGAAIQRPACYLCRDTAFQAPFLGTLLPLLNAIPVNRDGGGARGMLAILERLGAGLPVLLFPEGTRTSDGRLQPAKSGIGLLAIKSGAPVVPVRIFGMYAAYNRRLRWPRPCPVAVKFGRPLLLSWYHEQARRCDPERLKVLYQDLTDEIMRAIARLEPCEDVASFPADLEP
jgi:1-acyl-sn-glycerol-3-phosphate acyltransferase